MTSFSWNKKVGEKVNITKRKNFEETSKDDVLVECVPVSQVDIANRS